MSRHETELNRRLFGVLRDIGLTSIGSVEACKAALQRNGLRLVPVLSAKRKLGDRCRNGHLLTPETTTIEIGRSGKYWLRCKRCTSERKKHRYDTDPLERRLKKAYAHWFKCGHPEGLTWPELKARIIKETNHGQSSPVELSGMGARPPRPEPATASPQSEGVHRLAGH